jgi:hypothetical protein
VILWWISFNSRNKWIIFFLLLAWLLLLHWLDRVSFSLAKVVVLLATFVNSVGKVQI